MFQVDNVSWRKIRSAVWFCGERWIHVLIVLKLERRSERTIDDVIFELGHLKLSRVGAERSTFMSMRSPS